MLMALTIILYFNHKVIPNIDLRSNAFLKLLYQIPHNKNQFPISRKLDTPFKALILTLFSDSQDGELLFLSFIHSTSPADQVPVFSNDWKKGGKMK